MLPLASAFLTASMSRRGGLRIADSLLYGRPPGGSCGDGVPRASDGVDGSVALADEYAFRIASVSVAEAAAGVWVLAVGRVLEELEFSTYPVPSLKGST